MGGVSANRVTSSQADEIGGNSGEEFHQLTENELPSRTGYISHSGSNQNNDSGGMFYVKDIQNGIIGNDQPHNNMPPYMALNYIIKY
jgi:microcystin-dependent protein